MTTQKQLCDEAYTLMLQLSNAEDSAVWEDRNSDAERLSKIYLKANRRWWRRYHQLNKRSENRIMTSELEDAHRRNVKNIQMFEARIAELENTLAQADEVIKRLAEYRKVLIAVDSRLSLLHGLVDHTIEAETDRRALLEYLNDIWKALPEDVAYYRKIKLEQSQ